MGNKAAKRIKLEAKKFKKLKQMLMLPGSYLWLLEKVGFTGTYTRTAVVEVFNFKYNEWKDKTHVRVPTQDAELVDALFTATDCTINGDVYEIEKRTLVPPDAFDPNWRFYCARDLELRTFTEDDLPS